MVKEELQTVGKKVVFPDVKLEASYENGEQPYEEDINPCLKLAMLIHKN